ncbi:MAG: hypothetical protein NC393_08085 [Clostridium sp.]|nr:hypothetical protein [Clostridium sp.]MCM1207652.1 hypothetical protein [Ruminococcus sp.]
MELAQAYIQIIPSAEGIKGKLEEALGGEAAGESVGKKIASGIKTAILAAGFGKILKQAITEGSALEQSLGGIETLYKDSADKMIKYADEAYKTAGISANAYMEQATSFAAALVQSLGGDTEAAAEAANQAIIDMADNSNKMGTSMESIQTAYQGFAKQNYTMLDNLKLGYGGTKQEMERLLADAQQLSGVEYDIQNLSDVYNAIHVIQEELDITGTTAEEAEQTMSGSFAAMQASFSNLLGNMSLGRDISGPLQALVETTVTYLSGNLLPAIINVISNLPQVIGGLINELPGIIGNIVMTAIPQLLTSATTMITTLKDGFIANIPMLINQALPMLLSLSEQILANMSILIDAGIELVLGLVDGLMAGLPTLIEYVPQIITNITNVINENMPKILAAAITIIITLAQGLIDALPSVVANMGSIVEAIFSVITATNWLSLGSNIIKSLVSGIKSLATTPVTMFKTIKDNIFNAFKDGISWSNLGKSVIDGIKSGITSAKDAVINTVKNIAKGALDTVKKFLGIHSPSRVFRDEVGKMIDYGLADGLENNSGVIMSTMDDIASVVAKPMYTDIQAGISIGKTTEAGTALADGLQKSESNSANAAGDIIINVQLGNEKIDTIIVKAIDRINYISGGR